MNLSSYKPEILKGFIVPIGAKQIADRLKADGYETFVVGGALRDFLTNKHVPQDVDLATNATPDQIRACFSEKEIGFSDGNLDFGMVRLWSNGELYDVATLRKDVSTDGRRAVVKFTDSLLDDLQRRDTTINAMALDINTNLLYGPGENASPLKAIEDAKQLRVVFVGVGQTRIEEDLLRTFRAIRATAQINGYLDPFSLEDIQRAVFILKLIPNEVLSAERVRNEMFKTLSYPHPLPLFLWRVTGLLYAYIPELQASEIQKQNTHHGKVKVLDHITATVRVAELPANLDYSGFADFAKEVKRPAAETALAVLKFTMLLHDVGKPATARWKNKEYGYSFIGHEDIGAKMALEICSRLRLPGKIANLVYYGVLWHMEVPKPGAMPVTIRRWARRVRAQFPNDNTLDPVEWLLAIRKADWGSRNIQDIDEDRIRELAKPIAEAKKSPVSGARVMELTGLKPSPAVGAIIRLVDNRLDEMETFNQDDIDKLILEEFKSIEV